MVFDKLKDEWNSLQEENDMLKSQIVDLQRENTMIEQRLNLLDQQSKCKTLRLLGLEDKRGENLAETLKRTLNSNLSLQQDDLQIEHCYRLKNKSDKPNSTGAVLIHFSSMKSRDEVYKNKSKLRGSKLILTENLTSHNYALLKKCTSKLGTRNVWTWNGSIYTRMGTTRKLIRCEADLDGIAGAERPATSLENKGRPKRRTRK
ncbi:uncharacterized protein LOC123684736 [Harmonia axyridis]|nr:uncharacterized protein LOC123684736 [Harmonia axyridis]